MFKGPITFADGSVMSYPTSDGANVASYASYNENHQYPGKLFIDQNMKDRSEWILFHLDTLFTIHFTRHVIQY